MSRAPNVPLKAPDGADDGAEQLARMKEQMRAQGQKSAVSKQARPENQVIQADAPVTGKFTAESPLGVSIEFAVEEDAELYTAKRTNYEAAFDFSNPADKTMLDQLLRMEMSVHATMRWTSTGVTDAGERLRAMDINRIMGQTNSIAAQVRSLQRALGMDKASRDKSAQDSPGSYLSTLLIRAKEYGTTRNEELIRAVDLWRQLQGIVERFDRSDETFRLHSGFVSESDIVQWVRTQIPEFRKIDAKLVKSQARWIGEL